MAYPLQISKNPLKTRLILQDCSHIIQNGIQMLFPDVVSNNLAFIAGCSQENWKDLFESMLIYCSCHSITTMFFVWDGDFYNFNVIDWRSYFPPVREDFHNYLMSTYKIGWSVQLQETPSNTIESYAVADCAIQMYISPPTSVKPSSVSTTIPSINARNPSTVGLITYRKLRCYAHSSLGMNMANPGCNGYIGNILSYCSAHGFNGVVFHTGSMTRRSKEEAIATLRDNIILGIRSKQGLYSKFLLETPAGEKNDILFDVSEFFSFIQELRSFPDIAEVLEVCVDTQHVFAAGYCPYNYLKEASKLFPIKLVHFNDSLGEWGCHVDRHAIAGKGRIPYPILEKIANFCMLNGIDMVIEY